MLCDVLVSARMVSPALVYDRSLNVPCLKAHLWPKASLEFPEHECARGRQLLDRACSPRRGKTWNPDPLGPVPTAAVTSQTGARKGHSSISDQSDVRSLNLKVYSHL